MSHHTILYVSCMDAQRDAHAYSTMVRAVRQYMLAALCSAQAELSVAYYVGTPTLDSRTRVRRIVKHENTLANALQALESLTESSPAPLGASFVLSHLLRGLLGEIGGAQTQGKAVRLSVVFSQVPSVASDLDLASSLNAAKFANVTVEFIYMAHGSDSDTGEQLAELVLLIANYAHVSLSRVALHATMLEDLASVRSAWLTWSVPRLCKEQALLSLSAHSKPIQVQAMSLVSARNAASNGMPEKMLSCKCHGLIVSAPPRCQVTGRKPSVVPVHGYKLGSAGIVAVDHGGANAPITFTAFATVPAAALDCSIVMGDPQALESADPRLQVLQEQLRARDCCLLLRKTDRFGVTLHMAAPSAIQGGRIVLVRVAAEDDVIHVKEQAEMVSAEEADPAVVKWVSDELSALPHPTAYNPLTYSTHWSEGVAKAILESSRTMDAATATAAQSKGGLVRGMLEVEDPQ